jgi:hypothetical protein
LDDSIDNNTASDGAPKDLPVGIDLIHENRPQFTALTDQVSLAVPLEIQPRDATPPVCRILPDSGVHSALSPREVARQSDIHR